MIHPLGGEPDIIGSDLPELGREVDAIALQLAQLAAIKVLDRTAAGFHSVREWEKQVAALITRGA